MYHIGIKTGLFVRRIKVTQHELGAVLNYAALDRSVVTMPASAIKKFVVYPDYWDHLRRVEEEKRAEQIVHQDETQLKRLSEEVFHLRRENESLRVQPPMRNVPVQEMQAPRRQPTPDELMEPEVLRRARERINGLQPS